MASERDMELLDDYLRNKLSGQDKSAFEEVLKNDAGLQKEMRVQQQVVNIYVLWVQVMTKRINMYVWLLHIFFDEIQNMLVLHRVVMKVR